MKRVIPKDAENATLSTKGWRGEGVQLHPWALLPTLIHPCPQHWCCGIQRCQNGWCQPWTMVVMIVRGRGGKTTSGNGQAWRSPSTRRQWRTEKNGGKWLPNHLWCPNDPRKQPSQLRDRWDDESWERTCLWSRQCCFRRSCWSGGSVNQGLRYNTYSTFPSHCLSHPHSPGQTLAHKGNRLWWKLARQFGNSAVRANGKDGSHRVHLCPEKQVSSQTCYCWIRNATALISEETTVKLEENGCTYNKRLTQCSTRWTCEFLPWVCYRLRWRAADTECNTYNKN